MVTCSLPSSGVLVKLKHHMTSPAWSTNMAMINGWSTKKSVCFPDISRTFPTSSGLRKLSEPELAAKATVPMSFSSPVPRHSLPDDARSNEAHHGGPQHGEWRSPPWSQGWDWKTSWPSWKMAADVLGPDLDS